jgi:hypothetical protein
MMRQTIGAYPKQRITRKGEIKMLNRKGVHFYGAANKLIDTFRLTSLAAIAEAEQLYQSTYQS